MDGGRSDGKFTCTGAVNDHPCVLFTVNSARPPLIPYTAAENYTLESVAALTVYDVTRSCHAHYYLRD
jgi:hypothetical protein